MYRLIVFLLSTFVLVSTGNVGANAQAEQQGASTPTSAEAITRALRGRIRRGPMDPAAVAAEHAAIVKFKERSRRGAFNLRDRDELYAFSENKPQLALTIYFALDSAEIVGQATADVDALAEALSSPEFRGRTFKLGGHTDARGGSAYNLDLSQRRAEAVKSYLVQVRGLSPDNIIAVGFGAEKLKNTQNPRADENRRVQVVNLGE